MKYEIDCEKLSQLKICIHKVHICPQEDSIRVDLHISSGRISFILKNALIEYDPNSPVGEFVSLSLPENFSISCTEQIEHFLLDYVRKNSWLKLLFSSFEDFEKRFDDKYQI